MMRETFDANETWIKEATSSEDIEEDAFNKLMDLRYGKKSVVNDPSDPEASKIAASKGYIVMTKENTIFELENQLEKDGIMKRTIMDNRERAKILTEESLKNPDISRKLNYTLKEI